jgi:hypothetical protein
MHDAEFGPDASTSSGDASTTTLDTARRRYIQAKVREETQRAGGARSENANGESRR